MHTMRPGSGRRRRISSSSSSTRDDAAPGSFYLGQSSFSVYEEMAGQLLADGWRRVAAPLLMTADCVLGDRFSIPYARLRGERVAVSSRFGGTRWVNYFEGSHHLTRKAAMVQLLTSVDTQWASWLPESYVVGGDPLRRVDDRASLMAVLAAAADQSDGDGDVWIVKPSSGAKGRDILLLRAAAVPAWLARLPESGSRALFVVQRYVDRPLLLRHGRKFDIRVWALLASPYSIYAYAQASCRTASAPYDLTRLDDVHAHLTNHCLQTDAANFGEYEVGNEMWLPELQAYLSSTGRPPDLLEARVLPAVRELLVRTLLAAMPMMAVATTQTYMCFQLFGYDVMLTDAAEVRLLEINGSPGVADRLLAPLVRSMRELLRMTGSTATSAAAATVTREWRLDGDGFVLLWRVGDAVPDGLVGVSDAL